MAALVACCQPHKQGDPDQRADPDHQDFHSVAFPSVGCGKGVVIGLFEERVVVGQLLIGLLSRLVQGLLR